MADVGDGGGSGAERLLGRRSVIALGVLLAEFGMFRQALLRDQVRLYAAQSALISVLAILVAAVRHLPDLYVARGAVRRR